ncbi:MAG: aminotransferase class V-fold PLP-dependent enzyme, partial [Candidatus Thermofonsia bacterium]
DAIQAATTQTWNMTTMPIDLLSISAHKFYGPKGAGILYIRQSTEIISMLTGGGQEHGLRAGTSNVAFAVGAAAALQLVHDELDDRLRHYTALRNRLITGILAGAGDNVVLTGHPTERLPHNASFAFRHISGNDLLMHLDMAGIAASSGSACKSGNPKPSAVLEAIGLSPEWTKGGLRLTVGMQNSEEEIDYAIEQVVQSAAKLQAIQQKLA